VLAAVLVDVVDAFLEIHTALDCAEHFVARDKDTLEELKLLGQQLIDSLVGGILSVEEVYHHHVVLLSVAMAPTNSSWHRHGFANYPQVGKLSAPK
jgi:hypothetical protein